MSLSEFGGLMGLTGVGLTGDGLTGTGAGLRAAGLAGRAGLTGRLAPVTADETV